MKRVAPLIIAAALCVLEVSAASAATHAGRTSTSTPPKRVVYRLAARLGPAPKAKAPRGAHGRLRGQIAISGKTGKLRWTLSFQGLPAKARAADIELLPSGKVLVPLCAPCRSGRAGSFAGSLGGHSRLLKAILGGHTEVAVQTKRKGGVEILGALHASSVRKPAGVVVSTRKIAGLGRVLVDGKGLTLYMFVPDKHAKVTCVSTCAEVWPPLKVTKGGKPIAGNGVKASLLGSDPDPAGGRVVTYAGWPLYT